jgi:hypothetical protein
MVVAVGERWHKKTAPLSSTPFLNIFVNAFPLKTM